MSALRFIRRGVQVLILMAVRASLVHAQEVQQAPLALFVNEEEKDTVTVLLRGEEVLVARRDLENAGLKHLSAKALETVDGTSYVALGRLSPAVKFRVDERSLSLHVDAPAEYFEGKIVSLDQKRPDNLVQYRDTGIFLNYVPRLVDFRAFAATAEVGRSFDGQLLYSGVSYDAINGPVRGLTNLTVDDPPQMLRWVIGDSVVTGVGDPLAGSVVLGGVSLERAFDLDAYFIRFPTPTMSGTALTASTLDIYVNGVLVRREPVSPGPFQLRGIPATSGAGTTRYVLRDTFGREQQFVSSFYASAGVLSRGVADYGIAAGVVRNALASSSWDYGIPALSARYRRGITDRLTLGFRAEAPIDRGHAAPSGGPSITLLSPLGQLDLGFAASSAGDAGRGIAGSASYLYQSQAFTVGLGARSMSPRFSNLSLAPSDDHTRLGVSSSVSAAIGRHGTLTLNYLLERSRDRGRSESIGAQSSAVLSKTMTLNLGAVRTRSSDGTAAFETFASLSIHLGDNVIGSASGHAVGDRPDGTLDVTRAAPAGIGYGYQAAVTQAEQTSYRASVQGQIQYGQPQVSLIGTGSDPHTEISFAGGVVVVPGAGLFFTRPVQDGYAVIQVPGAENVRGYLNNNEIGRTDRSGNLLVPNLLSYYANRLSVSDQDLPPDYQIDGGAEVAATPYRGAAIVRFDAKRVSFIRGKLVVRHPGKDVIPAYGEMTVKLRNRVVVSPIAREGEVEFEWEGLAAGSHSARIEYAEGVCDFMLAVPERKGPVAELGTIVCVTP